MMMTQVCIKVNDNDPNRVVVFSKESDKDGCADC